MNWNKVVCLKCGLVNDYNMTEKSNNTVCYCNGCDRFLGNKPKSNEEIRMPFGKYKGRLLKDIAIVDLPYVNWFYNECSSKLSSSMITAFKKVLNK